MGMGMGSRTKENGGRWRTNARTRCVKKGSHSKAYKCRGVGGSWEDVDEPPAELS